MNWRILAYVVLIVASFMGQRDVASAEGCYETCLHHFPENFETYGEPWCCTAEGGGLLTRPCSPLESDGYSCPTWVLRRLEESGCWALDPVEGEGVACFETGIAAVYKELIGCDTENRECIYGDEVPEVIGGTVCWECPSDGPPGGG